jgi:hypothetical protein
MNIDEAHSSNPGAKQAILTAVKGKKDTQTQKNPDSQRPTLHTSLPPPPHHFQRKNPRVSKTMV